MRDTLSEALFSLFTSLDHAEAIAGDLAEERDTRGSAWFWRNVARTVLALWARAVIEAPLTLMMLAASACVLFIGPAFVGAAAVGLFPQLLGSFVSWMTLSLCWSAGAFWVGTSLVDQDPRRAMAACATLAVITEMALVGAGIAIARNPLSNDFYTTGLLVPAALLAGAAIARRRNVAGGIPAVEQP